MISYQSIPTQSGYIAHIQLANERALNALTHTMSLALESHLDQVRADAECEGVLISGAGEKAFCAGGDVRALAGRIEGETESDRIERALRFFQDEYRLDQKIYEYPKPLVVWGHGIVMGGGMGLLQGAQRRVVTRSTRIAMPETAIGFFPDVGGSWFLNRVTAQLGELVALSGMHINGADAVYLNLADHLVEDSAFDELLQAISQCAPGNTLLDAVDRLSVIQQDSPIQSHQDVLMKIQQSGNIAQRIDGLLALRTSEHSFLSNIAKTTAKGSPLSQVLSSDHLARTRSMSLSECFAQDLKLAQVMLAEEFVEGVRAVLIDRDGQPNWQCSDLAQAQARLLTLQPLLA